MVISVLFALKASMTPQSKNPVYHPGGYYGRRVGRLRARANLREAGEARRPYAQAYRATRKGGERGKGIKREKIRLHILYARFHSALYHFPATKAARERGNMCRVSVIRTNERENSPTHRTI